MRLRRGTGARVTAADSLRPLLYGDLPIEEWPRGEVQTRGEPWSSFVRARQHVRDGDQAEAIAIWTRITQMSDVESRHVLQAWTFLRAAGVQPQKAAATAVLAAVAEVAVPGGHDLLISYRDGSTRYLNVSGKVLILEGVTTPVYTERTRAWLTVAEWFAGVVGPWNEPDLPVLPTGHTRIMMLTPAGPRFGQGPDAALRAEKESAIFLGAATAVLTLVTSTQGLA